MKTQTKINYIFFIMFFSLIISSCGEDSVEISEEELNTTKLVNVWNVGENGEVRRDDNLITSDFQDFSIRFSNGNSYVVQNDPINAFQPSGTWRFAEGTFSEILLNSDRRPINIEFSNNDENLILRFTIDEDQPIGSRTYGLSGSYEFQLTK